MPRALSNGIELEYDSFGDSSRPALLLVMGWATQMIAWDERFCEQLAARGFHVIRFDNRDVGLSTKLDQHRPPTLLSLLAGRARPAYSLDDMAADAAGLLDALGIARAHVVGASMGGFIAQLIAINHPDRVLSLTSMMSGIGGSDAVGPSLSVALRLVRRPPAERDALIEWGVRTARLIGSPDHFDEARVRAFRARSVDRAVSLDGVRRQFAAISSAPSRKAALGRLDLPALVIHGEADRLVPIENGRRTAAAIPGARLLTIPGMGHDLPPGLWPLVLDAIVENAHRVATPA